MTPLKASSDEPAHEDAPIRQGVALIDGSPPSRTALPSRSPFTYSFIVRLESSNVPVMRYHDPSWSCAPPRRSLAVVGVAAMTKFARPSAHRKYGPSVGLLLLRKFAR